MFFYIITISIAYKDFIYVTVHANYNSYGGYSTAVR